MAGGERGVLQLVLHRELATRDGQPERRRVALEPMERARPNHGRAVLWAGAAAGLLVGGLLAQRLWTRR